MFNGQTNRLIQHEKWVLLKTENQKLHTTGLSAKVLS